MARNGVTVIEIDHGWEKLTKEMKKFNNSYTAIGYYGSGESNEGKSISSIAAVMENGSIKKRIPPRPFMKMTYDANKDMIVKIIKKEMGLIYTGFSTSKKSLSSLGEWYVGQMKKMITTGSYTALSAKTIYRKKSSKPLIDTGTLRNSTTHREFKK